MNNRFNCRKCGYENPVNITNCIKCGKKLRNTWYYKNDFNQFYQLFSDENYTILKHSKLTETGYHSILNNVIELNQDNIRTIPDEVTLDNILTHTKAYVNVLYDDRNRFPDYASFYSFNNIFLNRHIRAQVKPSAIIHEFSHHLFNEILKQSIMHMLNMDKNLFIESFVWYLTLQNDYIQLSNEFLAHKVQNHFFLDNAHKYTSVKKILDENDVLTEDKIKQALSFGSSIADDIIFILGHFLSSNAVMYNYEFDDYIEYPVETMSMESKLFELQDLILRTFNYISMNKVEMLEVLNDLNNRYISFNF